MKQINISKLLGLAVIVMLGASCTGNGQGEQLSTESGITYEFIEKGSGERPPEGGYWTLNVDYFNHTGEKMFSSADQGGPMTMGYIPDFPKNASIEECLSLVGNGDSAVFTITADSLYLNSSGRQCPPDMVGTAVIVHIGVEAVYSSEEYMAMMREKDMASIKVEEAQILAYIESNGINHQVSEDGIYYEMTEEGSGEKAANGKKVFVNYTGYLLDGTVFDTSVEEIAIEAGVYNPNRPYGPIDFTLGAQQVIRGWDLGIAMLSKGGKAKFIIPSPLAYGNRSMGNTIKANSILVFDVELVDIVE